MNMKTLFTILLVSLASVQSWSETNKSATTGKAILSYALPSKLDWTQATNDELGSDNQIFTLGENKSIRLSSTQVGNDKLWAHFVTMDKEKIFKELVDGKKVVHSALGYKNWKADKSIHKKSEKEIIFEITGSYDDDKDKNYFVEKYYMTPFGFVLISLDWTDKADKKLAEKAKDEFKNITFKSEIK